MSRGRSLLPLLLVESSNDACLSIADNGDTKDPFPFPKRADPSMVLLSLQLPVSSLLLSRVSSRIEPDGAAYSSPLPSVFIFSSTRGGDAVGASGQVLSSSDISISAGCGVRNDACRSTAASFSSQLSESTVLVPDAAPVVDFGDDVCWVLAPLFVFLSKSLGFAQGHSSGLYDVLVLVGLSNCLAFANISLSSAQSENRSSFAFLSDVLPGLRGGAYLLALRGVTWLLGLIGLAVAIVGTAVAYFLVLGGVAWLLALIGLAVDIVRTAVLARVGVECGDTVGIVLKRSVL